ncbi:MAG: TIGR00153 family protein [Verrucomicrobia bacterium]|nr:TIGR00153 family protein [Verrucomicrobiota bacterium]MBS0645674.1 TIGR00153 family protein [Verrucomicrobiota bacterium]
MQTLARLFGRSPFAPLQAHMEKVAECVGALVPLFEALERQDRQAIHAIADSISSLEHAADLLKNDMRNHLASGLFLPVPRASILELLSLQDNIADQAEDVGVLLTLKPLPLIPEMSQLLWQFIRKNIEAFEGAHEIIRETDRLLESSFGGLEAERVQKMIGTVALREHEADLLQRQLLQCIFGLPNPMDATTLFLWMRIIQELSTISDEAERLANRVRMLLEVA